MVFSNEFADAQSRYVALLTEAENARRFERTQRLVAINQPGRTEFDNATRNLRVAESTLVEMEAGHHRITRLVEIGAASVEEFEKHTTKLRGRGRGGGGSQPL